MKKILTCFLLCFPLALFAQWDENEARTSPEAKKVEDKPDFSHPRERWYVGGDFSLFVSNGGSIVNISPLGGYKLTKGMMAGIGFTYQYTAYFDYYNNRFTNNMFGARLFLRQDLFKIVFLNAEAEMYRTRVFDWLTNSEFQWNIPAVNVGIGFKRPITDLSYFQILIQYDLIQDRFSPYYVYPLSPLSLKLGVIINLEDIGS